MDQETENKFREIDQKLEKIYRSAETTRNYFKWTLIISVVVIILPLFGLLFAIPRLLSGMGSGINLLNGL